MTALIVVLCRMFGRPVKLSPADPILREIEPLASTHRAEQSARKRNDTRGIGRAIRERREYVYWALKAGASK